MSFTNLHTPKLLIIILISLLIIGSLSEVLAVHLGKDGRPWAQKMKHSLDQPLNQKYQGRNFFINLGPTGIRAIIDPKAPKQLKVQYVFQDDLSPAKGLIDINDVIIGANGKLFKDEHKFHRDKGGRGWPGPPYELALAIENSQGKDGKLQLMVLKGGKSSAKKNVTLKLKKVGRFSKTYPWNCPRSEQLSKTLCDFLIYNGIQGKKHYQIQLLLSLWAAGDERVFPLVKSKVESLMNKHANPDVSGMVTWNWGFEGILFGEYYHMTRDGRVLPAVKALNKAYTIGMDYRSGGFSHRPFPFIEQRVAGGGPSGYGAMAATGGLSMLAQSIFRASGLPHSEIAYQNTHQAYLRSGNNKNGTFAYGFTGKADHAIIKLKNNNNAKSGKGVGYQVETGMKGLGAYTVVWPTKKDKKYKPTTWLKNEASTNMVFERKDTRLVVRQTKLPEPKRSYSTKDGGGGHLAPVGMGALAHMIGNQKNKTWNYLGKHFANGCGNSAKMLWDGHADAPIHAFFGVLGASRSDPKILRQFLDYSKTWIILAETHDGGLVDQPFGCQRNSTCSIDKGRTTYTHVALLLLSLSKKHLLITGRNEINLSITPQNSPIYAIQSSGMVIKHCKQELAALEQGKSSCSSLIKKLDRYTEKVGEKSEEASQLVKHIRQWVSKCKNELVEKAELKPAETMESIQVFIKRIKGFDEEGELKTELDKLKGIEGITLLSKQLKDLKKLEAYLNSGKASKSGIQAASKKKKRIAEKIKKIIESDKLDEKVKSEARSLLTDLNNQIAGL